MTDSRKTIPRVAPKAYDYVKEVLDFGFHNAHSVGMTARLEKEFAERFGQQYGIAHCNGTATMQSALMAGGVGVGDEVIVPTFTVFSTPAAVLHCNALSDGQALAEQVAERFGCVELLVAETGPTIGTHTGPGTVGVAFYAE